MSTRHHRFREIGDRPTIFTISSPGTYDLFALAGSPGAAGSFQFIVASGVIVYGTYPHAGLWMSATFPGGSVLTLFNYGYITGIGGGGGQGGGYWNGVGAAGGPGGTAIEMLYAMSIDNTYGYIWSGGAGGRGGDGTGNPSYSVGGGGGGGGQGYGSTGGAAGASLESPPSGPGGAGGWEGPGGGGGGNWGADTGDGGGYWGGGIAVKHNGYALTWLGGNNGTQVRGTVQA